MKKLDPAGAANTEEHGHTVRAMASPCRLWVSIGPRGGRNSIKGRGS